METIAVERLDPNFKHEVAAKPGGAHLRRCFACGTCTAGCPVFQVETDYNPRKIIRMILLGMRKELLSSKVLWLCQRCSICSANCPQDVDFSNIVMALRDMADLVGQHTGEFRDVAGREDRAGVDVDVAAGGREGVHLSVDHDEEVVAGLARTRRPGDATSELVDVARDHTVLEQPGLAPELVVHLGAELRLFARRGRRAAEPESQREEGCKGRAGARLRAAQPHRSRPACAASR